MPITDPTPRNRVEEVGPVTANGLRPLISYGKRETKGISVHYSGLVIDARKFPAIYTYDRLTVKADEMDYSTLDSSIHAIGRIVLEHGHSRKGSSIQLSFDCYNPKIKLGK